MDFYTLFKFLHVASAIAWVGGGITLFFLGVMAMRRQDDAQMMQIVNSVGFLAIRWFMPSSMLTLIFGIVLATLGGMWGEAWVVIGLVGFAATFLTGNNVLKPIGERIAALRQDGNEAAAAAEARRMLQISKFDYTMLFVIVFDMVFKPAFTDIGVLAAMAIALAAAAALFLAPALRTGTPQAA